MFVYSCALLLDKLDYFGNYGAVQHKLYEVGAVWKRQAQEGITQQGNPLSILHCEEDKPRASYTEWPTVEKDMLDIFVHVELAALW